jgi:toxin-antitoxin system PIN domain toxin
MRIPDVNVLVAAFRRDHPHHAVAEDWLRATVVASGGLGLSGAVASGFVRIVTNRSIFLDPTPLADAIAQVRVLRSNPEVRDVQPGPRHGDLFAELCLEADARGNLVSDAAHAALAIEHDAIWVTLDRDFARFPGLRWELPFG